jgi:hypothetical protein
MVRVVFFFKACSAFLLALGKLSVGLKELLIIIMSLAWLLLPFPLVATELPFQHQLRCLQ